MWVEGKWFEECEAEAYVKQLKDERDTFKKELISFLEKACQCIEGNDFDCSICNYYYHLVDKGCPSQVDTETAKARLKELREGK